MVEWFPGNFLLCVIKRNTVYFFLKNFNYKNFDYSGFVVLELVVGSGGHNTICVPMCTDSQDQCSRSAVDATRWKPFLNPKIILG